MEADEIVEKVREAAEEVYGRLGGGFDESIYRDAMKIELREEGIECVRERNIDLYYKDNLLGQGYIDLFVEGEVIVELKAKSSVGKREKNQIRVYLNSSEKDDTLPDIEHGILVNFPRFSEDEMDCEFCEESDEPDVVSVEKG
ncbi:MAG: GxxExxY protein [Candidatus Aenigmatarchaeota archaeon]